MDESCMITSVDTDTIPSNTILQGRGSVDAIINPENFNPGEVTAGTRYLILEDINVNPYYGTSDFDGPDAWKNTDGTDFQAHANDIIVWDGNNWSLIFNSAAPSEVIYITNAYTGTQYKWDQGAWSKTYEGIYDARLWRLIL
jgi:frataxin-like iron-binding protein CyaY